jgi:CSLREA domain-containing protein
MASLPTVLLAVTLFAATAAADLTFEVDSTQDQPDDVPGDGACASNPGGFCTLRAAIQEANARNEPILILLEDSEYTISEDGPGEDAAATGDFDVAKPDITIRGAGALETTVRTVDRDRVFDVRPAGELFLQGLTVQEGLSDRGGGIRNLGRLTLERVTVTNNVAAPFGGGIHHDGAELVVRSSTINWNAGGAGGGVALFGPAIFEDSTIDHNQGDSGGGIFGGVQGTLTLVNVTISGNRSSGRGGALQISEKLVIRSSTIVQNIAVERGGGFAPGFGDAPPDISNSILAGNQAPEGPDCLGDVGLVGPNLVGDVTGCTLAGDVSLAITGVDPGLEPLAPRGGAVETHGLTSTSPALDAGAADGCADESDAPLAADARGEPRVVDGLCGGTARCDLGAFERPAVRDDDADGAVDAQCPAGTDCDDEDPAVLPGTLDVCNGVDDDCSGAPDDGLGCSPVRGTLLALRDDDVRSLTFKSRQPALTLPAGGDDDDPTCRDGGAGGAVLELFGLGGSGHTASVVLPCDGWTAKERNGQMQAYVYAELDGPCRAIRVTRKGVTAKCVTGLDLDANGERRVGLILGTGGTVTAAGMRQYCADFGGRVRRDDETRFAASKASAPAACPTP